MAIFPPRIKIDLDAGKDNTFAKSIVTDVINAYWKIGAMFRDIIAPANKLTLKMDNSSGNTDGLAGRYSVAHANALPGLDKGRLIRVQSVHGNEAGPQLRKEGVDGVNPAPYFETTHQFTNIADALNAASFDADGTYTILLFHLPYPDDFWTDGKAHTLFSLEDAAGSASGVLRLQKTTTDGQMRLTWDDATGAAKTVDSASNTKTGEFNWILWAATVNRAANQIELFRDGVSVGTASTLNNWANGGAVRWGALGTERISTRANPAYSRLAHVAVYDAVLTAAELLRIYNNWGRASQQILATRPDALVAYWPLSETYSESDATFGTLAEDYGGNTAYGLTTTNYALAEGAQEEETAPYFDGTNKTNMLDATLANDWTLANGMEAGTILMWVNGKSATTWLEERGIFMAHDSGTPVDHFGLKTNGDGTVEFTYYYQGGILPGPTRASVTYSGDDWTMLAVAWSGTDITLYINGASWGTFPTPLAGTFSTWDTLYIGGDVETVQGWQGAISHLTLWTDRLTAAQMRTLWEAAKTRGHRDITDAILAQSSGTRLAYYPLWANSGHAASDSAGARVGTIADDNAGGRTGTTARGLALSTTHGAYNESIPTRGGLLKTETAPLIGHTAGSWVDFASPALLRRISGFEGTMLLWVRIPNQEWTVGGDGYLFGITTYGPSFDNRIVIYLPTGSNALTFEYDAGGTTKTVNQTLLAPDDWLLLAVTWSAIADEFKAYIDGQQVGITQTGLGTWGDAFQDAAVSTCFVGDGGHAGAQVKFLAQYPAIWNEPLSAAEIKAIYDAGDKQETILKTRLDNLIGFWPLTDTGAAVDTADGAYSATLPARTGVKYGVTTNLLYDDASGVSGPAQATAKLSAGEGLTDGETAPFFTTSKYLNVYTSRLGATLDPTNFTVVFYFMPPDQTWWENIANQVLFRIDVGSGTNRFQALGTTTNNQLRGTYIAGGVTKTQDATVTTTGEYIQVAMTVSSGADQFKYYVNGALIGTATGLGTWAGTISQAAIGNGFAASVPAKCHIAHFAAWNTVLTANELAELDAARDDMHSQVFATNRAALVAYWPLTDNAAALVDGDTAPLFDAATSINATGVAPLFDGAAGSLAAWVRIPDATVWTDATKRYVARIYAGANNNIELAKTTTNNQLQFLYRAGGTTDSVTTTAPAGSGDWVHLVLTWDAANDALKAYLDGAQIGTTQTGLGTWAGTPTSVTIGSDEAPGAYWSGQIAHVALWDAVLDDADVLYLRNHTDPGGAALQTRPDALAGYWPLTDTGTRATTADAAHSSVYRTRNEFLGQLDGVAPDPDQYGTQQSTLTIDDFFSRAQRREVSPAVLTNATGDEAIDEVITRGRIWPFGMVGFWRLGVEGLSNIGRSTILGGVQAWGTLDPGAFTFPYVFANLSGEKPSIYSALQQIASSERAWMLWPNRDGLLEFRNHQYDQRVRTPKATFDNSMTGMQYTYGDFMVNSARVRYHPLEVQTENAPYTLATRTQFSVPATTNPARKRVVKLTMQYTDASGAAVSTNDPIYPVPNEHYFVRGGHLLQYDVSAKLELDVEFLGDRVVWTMSYTNPPYIHPKLGASVTNIRQTANSRILDFSASEVEVVDSNSVDLYEKQPVSIDASLIATQEEAIAIGSEVIDTWSEPRSIVRSITFRPYASRQLMEYAIALTVGDRITVSETQTGASGDYFIVGVTPSMPSGGANGVAQPGEEWTITYDLRPAPRHQAMLLGVPGASEVGLTTRLWY